MCVCVGGVVVIDRSPACVRCKTQVVPVRMDPVRDRRLQGRDTLVSQLWCHGRPTQQAGRHGWRLRTIRARQVLPVLSTRPAGAVPRFCEHCSSILLYSPPSVVSLECIISSYRPGGSDETICPRRWQFERGISTVRPFADGSAVCTWLSCRQPACL